MIETAETPISAFDYLPGSRSAIGGLGGPDDPHDPSYAFHTRYLPARAGEATFTLWFDGLQATHGTLRLYVLGLPEAETPARLIVKRVLPMAELAAANEPVSLRFEAEPETYYAVFGEMAEATDARADDLHVRLDRWGDGARFVERVIAGRAAIFDRPSTVGRRWWRRSGPLEEAGLISRDRATLRVPVSQMCTAAQFEEPDYDRWLAALGTAKAMHRKQWEFVYILQVLERHGMLREGARGLGFGVGAEYLPAFLAARGCSILATDLPSDSQQAAGWTKTGQHSQSLAELERPELCPTDIFRDRVAFRAVDMNAIPADLQDFDFCWSACAYEHLGSIELGLRFFRESVRCLRPGGIAVHTTELNLSSDNATIDNDATVLFRRRDMERLALELIAAGHEVMPITYDQGDRPVDLHIDIPPFHDDDHLKIALRQYVTTSFGLIARRGAL